MTNKLRDICQFLSFQVHLFNNLISLCVIKVANVEALLAIDLVSELCETLSKLERLDDSIFMLDLIGNLVWALGSKPLVSPIFQDQIINQNITLRVSEVVTFLQRGYEVVESGVSPCKLLKVDLKTFAKGLPTHQEDKLLQKTCSLTISNSINERL